MTAMTLNKKSDLHDRRRGRNAAVFVALVALILLIFAVTIVKLGPNAGNPSSNASWGSALVEWLQGDVKPANVPVDVPAGQPIDGAAVEGAAE